MTISNTGKSGWTQEMDAQLKNAISAYNENYLIPFPEVPFNSSCPFSQLKREYLQDLDKGSKQIRERWVNHLSPKIRAVGVLDEDKEVVRSFCRESPNEWAKVSRRTYEFFKEKQYYPDNTIKNFHFQLVRKDARPQSPETSVDESTVNRPVGKNSSRKKASLKTTDKSIKDVMRESKKRVFEEKYEMSPLGIVDLIERVDEEEHRFKRYKKEMGFVGLVPVSESSNSSQVASKLAEDNPIPEKRAFEISRREELYLSNLRRGIAIPAEPHKGQTNIERMPQESAIKNSSSIQNGKLQFPDILGCDALAELFW